MKADQIIKNAKVFTADKDKPMASALAVKDGKFVYVGRERSRILAASSSCPASSTTTSM